MAVGASLLPSHLFLPTPRPVPPAHVIVAPVPTSTTMRFLSLATVVLGAAAARPDILAPSASADPREPLPYAESLRLRPLPRNKVLASFNFRLALPPLPLEYVGHTGGESGSGGSARHYGAFPRSLEPVVAATNTRELHLRFTQGWWDSDAWGALPANGSHSGGTGVELWAAIEAASAEEAARQWERLTELLLGFFCASLNSVSAAITTRPLHAAGGGYVANSTNLLYVMRAALPDEPICTENLTPFLKMLPTRGKAGVALVLDGHKLFDSLWHAMGVDLVSDCSGAACVLRLDQNIHKVVDIDRLLRRRAEGGIPKPVPGDNLRCDPEKHSDKWHCFPLGPEPRLEWDMETVFGRRILGPGFEDAHAASVIHFDLDHSDWNVHVQKHLSDSTVSHDVHSSYVLQDPVEYNFRLRADDSSKTLAVPPPPVLVSRSLTGYSQDKGGMRVKVKNPSQSLPVSLVYFETLPWFMRVYLHTLSTAGSGHIQSQFYRPAIDRARPGHLELEIVLPPGGELVFTYDFDKSLLLYAEYPPDANHGFSIAPAVVKVVEGSNTTYEVRTHSLLLTLPTPDFSMPYNVIILTCTAMALAFGTVFNLLTRRVVTEEELEVASKTTVVYKVRARIQALKAKLKGHKAEVNRTT